MNCPRCTLLLGLLAAALLPRQPDSTSGPAFVAGMRSVHVGGVQLHYTRNVSEAEAERVAAWLLREEVLARRVRRIAVALSEAELKGARIQVWLRDVSGRVLVTLYPADEGPFMYNGAAP